MATSVSPLRRAVMVALAVLATLGFAACGDDGNGDSAAVEEALL